MQTISATDAVRQLKKEQSQPNPARDAARQIQAETQINIRRTAGLSPADHARTIELSDQTGLPRDVVSRNSSVIEEKLRSQEQANILSQFPALNNLFVNDTNMGGVLSNDVKALFELSKDPLFDAGLGIDMPDGSRRYFTRRPTAEDFPIGEGRSFTQASADLQMARQRWDQWRDPNGVTASPVEQDSPYLDSLKRGWLRGKRSVSEMMHELGLWKSDPIRRGVWEAERERRIETLAPDLDVQDRMAEYDKKSTAYEALQYLWHNPDLLGMYFNESFGQFAPTLATAVAGTTVGGPWTGAALTFLGSFTTEYGATIEKTMVDHGLDPMDAQSWTTFYADERLMAYARDQGVDRGIPIALMDALTFRLAGIFIRGTTSSPTSFIPRSTGEVAIQATGGATGERLAQINADEPYQPGQVVLEAILEIPTAAPEAFANYMSTKSREQSAKSREDNRAARAALMAERVRNAVSVLAKGDAVQTGDRGRQAVAEVLNQSAPDATVTISAREAQRVFQATGTTPEQFQTTAPNFVRQYPEALGIGGDIVMPQGEFIAAFMQTELMEPLLENVRLSPDAMTLREANAYLQEGNETLKAEIEESVNRLTEERGFEESRERVRKMVVDELAKANRWERQKIEADAALIAANAATRARQLGMTPEEFYETRKLTVVDALDQNTPALDQNSPAFREWFGDSRAVDETGAPTVVYHGTNRDISAFDTQQAMGRAGFYAGELGTWFGSKPDVANRFAEKKGEGAVVYPAYLSVKNPKEFGSYDEFRDFVKRRKSAAATRKSLQKQGYDGIVIRDSYTDTGTYRDDWVAFEDTQIKSIYNGGEFNPQDPEILNQSAYHGSPHEFDQFSLDAIGTGEGAQAFGWGLYFASRREIAEWYRDALSEPELLFMGERIRSVYTADIRDQYKSFYDGLVDGKFESFREYILAEIENAGGDVVAAAEAFDDYVEATKFIIATDYDRDANYDQRELMKEQSARAGAVLSSLETENPIDLNEIADDVEFFYNNIDIVIANVSQASSTSDLKYILGGFNGDQLEIYRESVEPNLTMTEPKGMLYQVDIPEDNELLQYDKPLSKQTEFVQKALESAGFTVEDMVEYDRNLLAALEFDAPIPEEVKDYTGEQIYNIISSAVGRATPFGREIVSAVGLDITGDISGYSNDHIASLYLNTLGIPGLRYLDRGSRRKGEGDHNYVIWDENRVTIEAVNDELRQAEVYEQRKGSKRGSFAPSSNTISLLRDADLSTFLHETGHYFFENDINLANQLLNKDARTTGEQQIVDDVHALLNWHGFDGPVELQIEKWNSLSFEERRPLHEKTAESFERYLFTGKAPSIELARVFQTFRQWLISVYTSLRDFLTSYPDAGALNDEVREVFDRMLASENEIKNAKATRSMMPLFAEMDPAMMTQDMWEAYQADHLQSDQEAIETMQAKGLRDMQWAHNRRSREIKRLRKQKDDVRAVVRMDARREVMSQPVYQAWTFLTNKLRENEKLGPKPEPRKSVDGPVDETIDTLFTAIAKLGGIQREELVSQWGIDPKEESPMPLFGKYVIRANGGLSIDAMAEALSQYGYLTLDENQKWDLADFETKFDESLRGGEVYSTGADYDVIYAEDESRAGDQILNPSLLGAGRFDLAALEDLDLPPEMVQRIRDLKMTARNGWHPDMVAERFGFESGDHLAREIAVSDQPNAAIEARVDQIMLERFAELATEEAIEEAANAAVTNEARARALMREFEAIGRVTGKKENGPNVRAAAEEYANNVISRTKVSELRPWKYENAAARAGRQARSLLGKNQRSEAYQELRNQIFLETTARKAHEAKAEVDRIIAHAKNLEKKSIQQKMRGDFLVQLNALMGRFDFTKVKRETKTPLAEWIVAQQERLSAIMPEIPDWILDEGFVKSHREMTMEELRGLHDTLVQLEKVARREQEQYIAVRNQNVKQEEQSILNELEKAHPEAFVQGEPNAYQKDSMPLVEEVRGRFQSKFDAQFMNLENLIDIASRGQGKIIFESLFGRLSKAADDQVVFMRELGKFLTKATKQYSAKERAQMTLRKAKVPGTDRYMTREQRIAVALFYGSQEGRQRLTDGNRYSGTEITAILDSLEEKDWVFVQTVWEMSEKLIWPKLAALNERTVGIAPQAIRPMPINTKYGTYRGGYVPLVYDGDMDTRAHDLNTNSSVQEMLGGTAGTAATQRSASKSRVAKVNRPLDLSLRAMAYKLNETVHDITHREAVADTYRILQRQRVADALRTILGPDAYNAMLVRVRETAVKPKTPHGFMEKTFWYMRRNSLVAMMGASFNTVAINVLGASPAMRRVGGANFMRALGSFMTPNGHQQYKWVLGKSKYMSERLASFDRDMNEELRRLSLSGVNLMPSLSFWFAGLSVMDRMITMPTWVAAYQDGMKKHGNDEQAAVLYADRIIRQTQGAGRAVDLANIAGGTGTAGEFKRIFTMVYNFFNAQLGGIRRGAAEASYFRDQGKRAKAAMMLTMDAAFIVVLPAVLEALARGHCGEDPDAEDYLYCAFRSSALFAGAFFPLFRDILPYTWKTFDSDYVGGFSVKMSPIEGGLEYIGRSPKAVANMITGDADDSDYKDLIRGLGWTFGLPSSQIWRTIDGYRAYADGDTDNPMSILTGRPRD